MNGRLSAEVGTVRKKRQMMPHVVQQLLLHDSLSGKRRVWDRDLEHTDSPSFHALTSVPPPLSSSSPHTTSLSSASSSSHHVNRTFESRKCEFLCGEGRGRGEPTILTLCTRDGEQEAHPFTGTPADKTERKLRAF